MLALGATGAVLATRIELSLGAAIAFTVGHFFLFCNVIRMARRFELAWAGCFLLLAGSTLSIQTPTWNQTFVIAIAVTGVVVFLQIRSPSYHGFSGNAINPDLPDWWKRRECS